jgi:predicted acetyltransferase
MSVEIRVRAPEEAVLFDRTLTASFGEEPGPGDSEHVVDPERDVAAYDGSQMVGTASAFPFELTIPRGSLAAPGVTAVGVLPKHRRQGILTRLVRHQLDDIDGRGEPVVALWAGEGANYGRFGYGLAALNGWIDCPRDLMLFREPAPGKGSTRSLGLEEALAASSTF